MKTFRRLLHRSSGVMTAILVAAVLLSLALIRQGYQFNGLLHVSMAGLALSTLVMMLTRPRRARR
jgi:hypothetical protein